MSAATLDTYRLPSVLALLVHLVFFGLMIFSVHWQSTEAPGMTVELWSDLPAPAPTPAPKLDTPPPPPPPEPEPVKKAEPKSPPPVPVKSPDIAVKAKPKPEEKPKPDRSEQLKQEKLKEAQARKEQLAREQLAQLARQQQAQAELARLAQAQQAAAHQSAVADYTSRIQSKVRNKLNRALCGDGKPQLEFDIALLPTGQLRGNPILRKGSGIPACDKAVEDAILQAEPLPVPPQPDVFNYFRELHLKFKPNE